MQQPPHPGLPRLLIWLAPVALATAVGCREDAELPTSVNRPSEPAPELAASSTQPLAFYQISGGSEHTCAVTIDNRAYCWGFGLLGDGNAYAQHLRPVAVTGGLRFHQVSAGAKHNCGVT